MSYEEQDYDINVSISIGIKNIEINESDFSFEYIAEFEGTVIHEGEYQSDHVWDDLESFELFLTDENGAVGIVIDEIKDLIN
jgi:hypothetical protein